MDLFLAEGFAQLTLDDLAAGLGCSKRTLYALADSKEQLAVRAVRHFFKRATEQVERRSPGHAPRPQVTRYLEAVAEALRPAGPAFRGDLDRTAATREVYEQNTAAAERVRELIDEGIPAGAFRHVSAAFVGEVVTATMRRITSGEIGGHRAGRRPGLRGAGPAGGRRHPALTSTPDRLVDRNTVTKVSEDLHELGEDLVSTAAALIRRVPSDGGSDQPRRSPGARPDQGQRPHPDQ